MPGTDNRPLSQRTIADFGEQWTQFTGNEGFYGSSALFADMCGGLIAPSEMRGLRTAEIGSGTGRIVKMMLLAGAGHVIAIEPSAAFDVLRRNVAEHGDRVECIHATGEQLPADRELDLVVSIGVLHHIPEPGPVVKAAHAALKPGGRMLVWLYGREGNGLYLSLTLPLRAITTRLPHRAVVGVARVFRALLQPYIRLCGALPLPLGGYFSRVFGHMAPDKQTLIIYDQLRPAYARYYTRAEAVALLADAGFVDIRVNHRHGYSWAVLGTRP